MKRKNKIKIKINGKYQSINQDLSVFDLTTKLKIPIKKVAIEINKKIIDKKRIEKINLKEKDKVEIVHFIGGG